MEANTTMTICPNGHPYDTAKFRCCPVCGASAAAFPHTEPVRPAGGYAPAASFPPTEPIPNSASRANTGFAPTVPPEMADAFTPTVAGDMLSAGGTSADPVVGWLVCVEGPAKGADFRIHTGYNYIGRNTGDICIHGDNQISRQNHAMVAFDSGDMVYFVGPASGRNLIKVNGKTVLNPVEIHSYDVISIGTTKLIFVALCGEKFSWSAWESGDGK